MRITKKILSLWQAGFYIPDDACPFTLEETLHDMQGEMKARNDYSDSFQTFAPRIRDEPQGIGQANRETRCAVVGVREGIA